jgi:hypothetical protein
MSMWFMRLRLVFHIFIYSRWPLRIAVAGLGAIFAMVLLTLFTQDGRAASFWSVIFVCQAIITMVAWRAR